MSQQPRENPLAWPTLTVEHGRFVVGVGTNSCCAAGRWWNAHEVSVEAQVNDSLWLEAHPEGYGRPPFPGELGPGDCPAEHLIEVTRNARGGIHYRLLHVATWGEGRPA